MAALSGRRPTPLFPQGNTGPSRGVGMAVEIKVPSVGESVTEGTISRWLKKDGEAVRADEPVLEVETEKATTEISAPETGTLRITVPEGQTVSVGAVVGRIEEGAPARQPAGAGRKDGTTARPREQKPDGKAAPSGAPKPKQGADVEAVPAEAPK